MKYTIKFSNIPAIIYVNGESAIFIAMNVPVQMGIYAPDIQDAAGEAKFKELPMEVQAYVNREFGTVFTLPVDRRADYVKNSVPFTIEV